MLDNFFLNFSLHVLVLTVDILNTFCDGSMVHCFKLMLSKFLHLWFLLFICYICRQYVTCLKRFTRCGHYIGQVDHCQSCNCFLNHSAKNQNV